MQDKIELAVMALSESQSLPGCYTLVLEDLQQQRRIPVTIGEAEAQAIAIAMEKMQPIRPLTHDLFKNMLDALGVSFQEVWIDELKDEIFCAKIILRKPDGSTIQLDSRTSDAIALAVRFDAPVYTTDILIEEAGILTATIQGREKKGSLAAYSLSELEDLLQRVVYKEDYESATRIRNYMEQRRKKE